MHNNNNNNNNKLLYILGKTYILGNDVPCRINETKIIYGFLVQGCQIGKTEKN